MAKQSIPILPTDAAFMKIHQSVKPRHTKHRSSHIRQAQHIEKNFPDKTKLVHHRRNSNNKYTKLPDTKKKLFHKSNTTPQKSQSRSSWKECPCFHVFLSAYWILKSLSQHLSHPHPTEVKFKSLAAD